MAYPPPVTKKERKVLEVIGRGHPERTMKVRTAAGGSTIVNALNWNEIVIGSGLATLELSSCIPHLGTRNLIDNGIEYKGILALLRGADSQQYFWWITSLGRRFLEDNPEDALPDVPPLPTLAQLKPSDIDEAAWIYEKSLSASPHVEPDKIAWAERLLDDDIKSEIAKAAQQLEAMWVVFERMFGHRCGAEAGRQADIRDPVVKKVTVRRYRAIDEQCRRMGLPPSQKPGAWLTHYNGGDVDLESAPWEQRADLSAPAAARC
jgi:hypothetical protein